MQNFMAESVSAFIHTQKTKIKRPAALTLLLHNNRAAAETFPQVNRRVQETESVN